MLEPFITIEDDPPEKDIRVLWDGIGEYNFSQTGLKGQPGSGLPQRRTA
jgi:hypothetical protein